MSQQRPLLPDETRESRRVRPHKTTYALLWTTTLLLSLVVISGLVVILFQPQIFGMELTGDMTATRVHIQQTEDALVNTALALGNLQSAFELTGQFHIEESLDLESTQIALENLENQRNNDATQVTLNQQGTQTAIANVNAQQATRSAIGFRNTQAAVDRVATQVELDFRGTQAALNRDATAVALGFATQPPSGQDILAQTPQPTATIQPLFEDGFNNGVDNGLWRLGSIQDWTLNSDAVLEAQRDNAWLLTQVDTFSEYLLEAEIVPGNGSDYAVLMNVTDNHAYALRLSYDGARLAATGFYESDTASFMNGGDLNNVIESFHPIQTIQVDIPVEKAILIRVEVRDNRVLAFINEEIALDLLLDTVPAAGAVGIQVPEDTIIRQIILSP